MGKQEQQVVGFYREGGKTKPIVARSPQASKIVKRYKKEEWADAFSGGRRAQLNFSMTLDDGGEIAINCPIRWETMKVGKLVETEYRTANGDLCQRKLIGGGGGHFGYINQANGQEVPDSDVILCQVKPDGSREEIKPFDASTEVKAEARDKELMHQFLPDSYLEIWSDDPKGQEDLRQLAWQLLQTGKVAAVKKFVKAKGTKAYIGFLYPVVGDDDTFGLEMMVSENRLERKRWMPAGPVAVEDDEKSEGEAEVPDVLDLNTPIQKAPKAPSPKAKTSKGALGALRRLKTEE